MTDKAAEFREFTLFFKDTGYSGYILCEPDFEINIPFKNDKLKVIDKQAYDQLRTKLQIATEALKKVADLDNPNEPDRCCWPTSDYMKTARTALKEIGDV